MKFDLSNVKVSICGIERREWGSHDVLIIDDPWEPPQTKRQRMRQRCMLLRWTMRMRKRMGLMPIPGVGFRRVEGEWDVTP